MRTILLLFLLIGLTTATSGQSSVDGRKIPAGFGMDLVVEVSEPFSYVDGQRFVLRGHTDVEQHFFVVADGDGAVQRMYWIQFEARLPHNEGTYRYPEAEHVWIDELDFATHVRYYDSEPVEDSDRGAAYRLLAQHGYNVPTPALRCRLVHIPQGDARRELMIVYLEASVIAELDDEMHAAMIDRAVQGLTVTRAD